MGFPVAKESTLLEVEEKYRDAAGWQIHYAEKLKLHKQTDRFYIAIRVIPGIKPRVFGVYLDPR